MKTDFQIRAVQLDLARQMESIPVIKEFIDLAAKSNFNTLFLYLEWRVRTQCLDLGENEAYSREELEEIISYAEKYDMTVIPGVAALGHGDIILNKPQYKHLSELREGIAGRFPASEGEAIDLCPSLPEVRTLLKEYLTECAQIFRTSPYIHVGCDEVYNIGYCSLCREKVKSYAEEGQLFLEHLLYVYDIVKSCSKKMMMWDDMTEFFEELIEKLPKDIVLVSWLYDENVYQFKGHFLNQNFKDMWSKYEKASLQYLIAPADYFSGNVTTFTQTMEKYHPLGGMFTTWEKAGSLLYKSFPMISYCGKLWTKECSDPQQVMDEALQELFPSVKDAMFFSALSLYNSVGNNFPRVGLRSLTIFGYNGPARSPYQALRSIRDTFAFYLEKVDSPAEKKILQDIITDCRLKVLKWESEIGAWEHLNGLPHTPFHILKEKVGREGENYLAYLQERRPPHNRERAVKDFLSWQENLDLIGALPEKGYLKLLLMLPDYYAVPFLKVFVNGTRIASSCYKLAKNHLYYVYLPLPEEIGEIREVRLELDGLGSLGVAHVSGRRGNETYSPAGLKAVSGLVCDPEYILTEDIRYALLGKGDVEYFYRKRDTKENFASLALEMQKGPQ